MRVFTEYLGVYLFLALNVEKFTVKFPQRFYFNTV